MGGDRAPDVVVAGADLARERNPDLHFLMFGDRERLDGLIHSRRELMARTTIVHTAEAVEPDAQAFACAPPGPQHQHAPGDRCGEGRPGERRRLGGQYRRADGAGEVRAQDPARDRPPGHRLARCRRGAARRCSSISAPTSNATPTISSSSPSWARCSPAPCSAFPSRRSACSTSAPRTSRATRPCARPRRRCAAASLAIEFRGFVEGTDLASGKVDVVVTDGFTGNVALKVAEGAVGLYAQFLREAFKSSLLSKLGYLLAKPALELLRAAPRPAALQRRHVPGPQRHRREEPWRHGCARLRQRDRRRRGSGRAGHQSSGSSTELNRLERTRRCAAPVPRAS